jgi:hypothetical protein
MMTARRIMATTAPHAIIIIRAFYGKLAPLAATFVAAASALAFNEGIQAIGQAA